MDIAIITLIFLTIFLAVTARLFHLHAKQPRVICEHQAQIIKRKTKNTETLLLVVAGICLMLLANTPV
jgi:hypothetical protein